MDLSLFVFATSNCDWLKYATCFLLANHRCCLQKQMKNELQVEKYYSQLSFWTYQKLNQKQYQKPEIESSSTGFDFEFLQTRDLISKNLQKYTFTDCYGCGLSTRRARIRIPWSLIEFQLLIYFFYILSLIDLQFLIL